MSTYNGSNVTLTFPVPQAKSSNLTSRFPDPSLSLGSRKEGKIQSLRARIAWEIWFERARCQGLVL